MGAYHGSERKRGPNKRAGEKGPDVSGCLGSEFTAERRAAWIAIIRECGRRAVACYRIGVHRTTVEKYLREDPEFKDDYEQAMLYFRESLVSEAVRRGAHGIDEPVFSRGTRVMDYHPDDAKRLEEMRKNGEEPRMVPAVIRRYSDMLLSALLKAHLPEFTERQIVKNEGPTDAETAADLGSLTPDEQAELQALMQRVKARIDRGESAPDVP